MTPEQSSTLEPRELELSVIARYAKQEGMPMKRVGIEAQIDPVFEGFFEDYFSDPRDQMIYSFIATQYYMMPDEVEDDDVMGFVNGLVGFKSRLAEDPAFMADPEAREAVGGINIQRAGQISAFLHGKSLRAAVDEVEAEGFVSSDSVNRLIYWSRIREINKKAIEFLEAEQDF